MSNENSQSLDLFASVIVIHGMALITERYLYLFDTPYNDY